MLTDMNAPLGTSIGNSLEVLEAISILKGEEDNHLSELCIDLSSEMVSMGLNISKEEARDKVICSIKDGSAYNKFLEFVKCQGGDVSKVSISDKKIEVKSNKNGTITRINALEFGKFSVSLGAGRREKDDVIDPTVGIKLNKLIGDKVSNGDLLCTIYVNKDCNVSKVLDFFEIC